MMLSRVAERVYWFARYLQRVNSTARLINIHQALLFDLTKNVELNWYNLIIINDLEQPFGEHYSVRSERNIVKFLICDDDNPSSVVNSIRAVRENVRTTRDVVPEEVWERICELSIYVQDNTELALNRRSRHAYLETIIKGCQQINGLLVSTMPKDEAWSFFSIGQHLERADMTTRYLEAGLTTIMALIDDEHLVNSQQIIWGSVLRTLNATQYYLRTTRRPVTGEEVVPYLLADTAFPKSVGYCVNEIIAVCVDLPGSEPVVTKLKTIRKKLDTELMYDDDNDVLLQRLNALQIVLSDIHFYVSGNWFPTD